MRTLLLLICLFPLLLRGQASITFDPDSILVDEKAQAEILLVGSFHFDYPGLDGHKTAEEDQIDVTTGQRAAEVRELIDYLARFRPTKIVVERRTPKRINEQYHSYLSGDFELPRSEIY